MIDKLSVDYAASILSKYLIKAKEKKNPKAESEIKSIMQVIQHLYDIAIKHKEI